MLLVTFRVSGGTCIAFPDGCSKKFPGSPQLVASGSRKKFLWACRKELLESHNVFSGVVASSFGEPSNVFLSVTAKSLREFLRKVSRILAIKFGPISRLVASNFWCVCDLSRLCVTGLRVVAATVLRWEG